MRSTLASALSLLLALAVLHGCKGVPEALDPEDRLPFTVRVLDVSPPQQREDLKTPADFDVNRLEDTLVRTLEEAGLFARVLHSDEGLGAADLDLEVTIEGSDFGEGQATVLGSTVSTVAWITAGHLSWFIDNRVYPNSDVSLKLTIREGSAKGARTAGDVVYDDNLPLRGLKLNFMERAGEDDWLLNILLPPWVAVGDEHKAGGSLADQWPEVFLVQETPRLLGVLPRSYFEKKDCYFGFDIQRDRLLVMARDPLERLTLAPMDSSFRRAHGEEDLEKDEHRVRGTPEIEAVKEWFRKHTSGLETKLKDEHAVFYRVPRDGLMGDTVRIEAVLRDTGEVCHGTVITGAGQGDTTKLEEDIETASSR